MGFGSLYSNMNITFCRATVQHPIHKLNHKELRKIGWAFSYRSYGKKHFISITKDFRQRWLHCHKKIASPLWRNMECCLRASYGKSSWNSLSQPCLMLCRCCSTMQCLRQIKKHNINLLEMMSLHCCTKWLVKAYRLTTTEICVLGGYFVRFLYSEYFVRNYSVAWNLADHLLPASGLL